MYARGRDYHRVLRTRAAGAGHAPGRRNRPAGCHRVFTDSAPVLEVELAARAAWAGAASAPWRCSATPGRCSSWRDLRRPGPTPPRRPPASLRSCRACLDICPTQAVAPLPAGCARRCILLTIEHDGAIPLAARLLLGNRIYGCDDCQLVCPGTSTRGARRCPTSTRARRWAPRRCCNCGPDGDRSSCAPHRGAARSAASATRAGSATWRWRLGTRCAPRRTRDRARARVARGRRGPAEHIAWALDQINAWGRSFHRRGSGSRSASEPAGRRAERDARPRQARAVHRTSCVQARPLEGRAARKGWLGPPPPAPASHSGTLSAQQGRDRHQPGDEGAVAAMRTAST